MKLPVIVLFTSLALNGALGHFPIPSPPNWSRSVGPWNASTPTPSPWRQEIALAAPMR